MDNYLIEKLKRQELIKRRDVLATDLKGYLDEERNNLSVDNAKLIEVSNTIGSIQSYGILYRVSDEAKFINNPELVIYDNGISNIILNEKTSSRIILDKIAMYLNRPEALISEKEIKYSGAYKTNQVYTKRISK